MARAAVYLRSIADDDVQPDGAAAVAGVKGKVRLEQANYDSPTKIVGEITGLSKGQHAISINVFGDISEGEESVGPHFNPFGKNHGAPSDAERHVGGLGNIAAGDNGVAILSITDSLVKLIGPQSIIGRSFVVYEKSDDFGKGGSESSMSNGNPGKAIAYGVIGVSS